MPISISNVEIVSDAEYGTALGVLAARAADDFVVDCVYSLSRGDLDLFVVSGNQLLTAWRTPPAAGIYPVRIRATGISTRFSGSATFMISVVDPPPPPPEPIPPQGAGPHFVIGANGRIKFAAPFELDSRGNLIGRIQELLPLVRRAAEELAPHLTSNSFPELARNLTEYRAAIAAEKEVIAWGLVFGLGVMLENAAAAMKRKIEDRLLPSLEDAAQSALDFLLTLHGPLILATGEGRELQEQADRSRMTREEQLRLRGDAEILALELLQSPDLIEPEVAATVVQAIQAIGEGRFPERAAVFGFATIKNVVIVLLSGAALAAFLPAGIALAGTLGGVATAGVAWVGYDF